MTIKMQNTNTIRRIAARFYRHGSIPSRIDREFNFRTERHPEARSQKVERVVPERALVAHFFYPIREVLGGFQPPFTHYLSEWSEMSSQ
jgi:hypothetical protein